MQRTNYTCTLGQFRRALKTHLFCYWHPQRRVPVFFMNNVYKLTYIIIYSLNYLLVVYLVFFAHMYMCPPGPPYLNSRCPNPSSQALLAGCVPIPPMCIQTFSFRWYYLTKSCWNILPVQLLHENIQSQHIRNIKQKGTFTFSSTLFRITANNL